MANVNIQVYNNGGRSLVDAYRIVYYHQSITFHFDTPEQLHRFMKRTDSGLVFKLTQGDLSQTVKLERNLFNLLLESDRPPRASIFVHSVEVSENIVEPMARGEFQHNRRLSLSDLAAEFARTVIYTLSTRSTRKRNHVVYCKDPEGDAMLFLRALEWNSTPELDRLEFAKHILPGAAFDILKHRLAQHDIHVDFRKHDGRKAELYRSDFTTNTITFCEQL